MSWMTLHRFGMRTPSGRRETSTSPAVGQMWCMLCLTFTGQETTFPLLKTNTFNCVKMNVSFGWPYHVIQMCTNYATSLWASPIWLHQQTHIRLWTCICTEERPSVHLSKSVQHSLTCSAPPPLTGWTLPCCAPPCPNCILYTIKCPYFLLQTYTPWHWNSPSPHCLFLSGTI